MMEEEEEEAVADLGFLKGGFRFRQITVIARIVSSWQASMSMQRLRSWCPSTRSAENLRSHLLTFQAPYSEHWSGGRQNCRICSTASVGLDSFLLLMACQTYYNFTVTMPTNEHIYLQTKLKLNKIAVLCT